MKSELREIINNVSSVNINDIFHLFKKSDDILILKYDGERGENIYTIILIGNNGRFDTIRYEGDDLDEGLRTVLLVYLEHIE